LVTTQEDKGGVPHPLHGCHCWWAYGNNNCNAIVVKGWGLPLVVDFLTTKKGSREGGGSTHK